MGVVSSLSFSDISTTRGGRMMSSVSVVVLDPDAVQEPLLDSRLEPHVLQVPELEETDPDLPVLL